MLKKIYNNYRKDKRYLTVSLFICALVFSSVFLISNYTLSILDITPQTVNVGGVIRNTNENPGDYFGLGTNRCNSDGSIATYIDLKESRNSNPEGKYTIVLTCQEGGILWKTYNWTIYIVERAKEQNYKHDKLDSWTLGTGSTDVTVHIRGENIGGMGNNEYLTFQTSNNRNLAKITGTVASTTQPSPPPDDNGETPTTGAPRITSKLINPSSIKTGGTAIFTVTASNPTQSQMTMDIKLLRGTGTIMEDNVNLVGNTAQYQTETLSEGIHTFVFTVTNEEGKSVEDTFLFVVEEEEYVPGPKPGTKDPIITDVYLQGDVYEGDQARITVEGETGPNAILKMEMNEHTRTITFNRQYTWTTPRLDRAGTYHCHIILTEDGRETTTRLTIQVKEKDTILKILEDMDTSLILGIGVVLLLFMAMGNRKRE